MTQLQLEKRRWRKYFDFLGDIGEINCKMNNRQDSLFDCQNLISSDHHDGRFRKKIICSGVSVSQD